MEQTIALEKTKNNNQAQELDNEEIRTRTDKSWKNY